MAESSIEWTDVTWNPVTGCTRASAGCDNCYAVRMTKRLEAMGQEKYSGLVNVGKGHFNGVVKTHEDALLLPLSWKKPRKVFVNSMSDLFHNEVPFEFIDKVFAVMALCPHITFQVLTKRPERMAEYFAAGEDALNSRWEWQALPPNGICNSPCVSHIFNELDWPLPNVWLGTSVENQETADERIPYLLQCSAAVRFLSCEPLLSELSIVLFMGTRSLCPKCHETFGVFRRDETRLCPACDTILHFNDGIHWVIAGGESGPKARPMHPDWARSLRDQCQAAGVPFFFKQHGEWAPYPLELSIEDRMVALKGVNRFATIFPDGTLYRDVLDAAPQVKAKGGVGLCKFGKHRAGRILDGRTWDEFPGGSK